MTPRDHEVYAADLTASLGGDGPETEVISFMPDPSRKRNAAKAMAVILCHRLFVNSGYRPIRKKASRNYEWKLGTFNCRNIADRNYFWANLRPGVANEIHDFAERSPAAYLLACCQPADTTMDTWAVPEPLLYDSLPGLNFEQAGQKYTLEIQTDKRRIERCTASPDLTPYHRRFQLRHNKILLLKKAQKRMRWPSPTAAYVTLLLPRRGGLKERVRSTQTGSSTPASVCYRPSYGEWGNPRLGNGCWRPMAANVLFRGAVSKPFWMQHISFPTRARIQTIRLTVCFLELTSTRSSTWDWSLWTRKQ